MLNLSTYKNIELINTDKCWNHQHLTILLMLTLTNVYMSNVDKHFVPVFIFIPNINFDSININKCLLIIHLNYQMLINVKTH